MAVIVQDTETVPSVMDGREYQLVDLPKDFGFSAFGGSLKLGVPLQ